MSDLQPPVKRQRLQGERIERDRGSFRGRGNRGNRGGRDGRGGRGNRDGNFTHRERGGGGHSREQYLQHQGQKPSMLQFAQSYQREEDLGISEYMCQNNPGFIAIIKHRFQDFLVNEINTEGDVVRLTSFSAPKIASKPEEVAAADAESTDLVVVKEDRPNIKENEMMVEEQKPSNEEKEMVVEEPSLPIVHDNVQPNNSDDRDANGYQNSIETLSGIQDNEVDILTSKNREREQETKEFITKLRELISDKEFLNNTAKILLEREEVSEAVAISEPVLDKDIRTKVHTLISSTYSDNAVYSSTHDGRISIYACKTNQSGNRHNGWRSGRGGDPRRRRDSKKVNQDWAELGGDYLLFHLYKENVGTLDALNFLALKLHVPVNGFTFAGTKDKRAVTVQAVTAYRLNHARLLALNRIARHIRIGNVRYVPTPLALGDHHGNMFEIVLRELKPTQEGQTQEQLQISIGEACELTSQHGFINYYGMQRFGTSEVGTHHIGRLILQSRWQEACDMILRPRENDRPDFVVARKAWKDNPSDPLAAMRLFPISANTERSILRGCIDQPNNHLGMLMQVPRMLLLMYPHAYQSYIWNHTVTERLRCYGTNLVVGDLVIAKHEDRDLIIPPNSHHDEDVMCEDPEDDVPLKNTEQSRSLKDISIVENQVTDSEQAKAMEVSTVMKEDVLASNVEQPELVEPVVTVEEVQEPIKSEGITDVIYLTEELIASGRYSISDVVLPMPGWSIHLPKHSVGEKIEKMLQNDNLTLASFKHRQSAFTLYGTYRSFIVKPQEMSYSFQQYTDANLPIVVSDLDKIKREKQNATQVIEELPMKDNSKPEKTALMLRFRLPVSAYATMLLREIMRTATSAGHHTHLTQMLNYSTAASNDMSEIKIVADGEITTDNKETGDEDSIEKKCASL